jgi:hypothetical protein
MAETTADVRRDIELTRERMSDTLMQLEQKLNLMQVVKDHPWPALAVAFGAGVLLSGSRADVKAAAATVAATHGASNRLGPVLDDLVSNVMTGVTQAFQHRVESLVDELKVAIGAPVGTQATNRQDGRAQQFASSTGGEFGDRATSGTTGTSGQSFGGEGAGGSGNRALGAMEGQGNGASWNTPRAD